MTSDTEEPELLNIQGVDEEDKKIVSISNLSIPVTTTKLKESQTKKMVRS